jgi:hypothetical protein
MASDGGLQPADFGDNFDAQAEREKLRAKLKDDIWSLWRNNKADKYNIGRHLATLQELHAKPGHGTFLEDLAELHIPTNTAYQRIKFYKRIEAIWAEGHEPTLAVERGLYRFGKDDSKFPVDTEYDADEKEEDLRAAADKKQAQIDEIIKAEVAKVAKLRTEQKGKVPRMNISLILSKEQRERFKEKWNSMDERTRSDRVYEAILNVVILNAGTT